MKTTPESIYNSLIGEQDEFTSAMLIIRNDDLMSEVEELLGFAQAIAEQPEEAALNALLNSKEELRKFTEDVRMLASQAIRREHREASL